MSRQCWTCNTEHDLDRACPASLATRSSQAAGGPADLFDVEETPRFGPVFMAQFGSDDACCGEGIVPGEDIRSDGEGGWIHASEACERMVRE